MDLHSSWGKGRIPAGECEVADLLVEGELVEVHVAGDVRDHGTKENHLTVERDNSVRLQLVVFYVHVRAASLLFPLPLVVDEDVGFPDLGGRDVQLLQTPDRLGVPGEELVCPVLNSLSLFRCPQVTHQFKPGVNGEHLVALVHLKAPFAMAAHSHLENLFQPELEANLKGLTVVAHWSQFLLVVAEERLVQLSQRRPLGGGVLRPARTRRHPPAWWRVRVAGRGGGGRGG